MKVGIIVEKENRRDAKKSRQEDNNYRGRKMREGVYIVFKDPLYKILPQIRDKLFFQWSPKLGGDPTSRDQKKFYFYHREKGHQTEQCRYLKSHLEDLAKAGHLD